LGQGEWHAEAGNTGTLQLSCSRLNPKARELILSLSASYLQLVLLLWDFKKRVMRDRLELQHIKS